LTAGHGGSGRFQHHAHQQEEKDAAEPGPGDQGVEGVGIRPFIRQTTANKVTHRQEKQNQANHVGPDDVGGAIDGLQHPAGGKFDGQGAHARHKNRQEQVSSIRHKQFNAKARRRREITASKPSSLFKLAWIIAGWDDWRRWFELH
jgi:hypothetical protein